MLMAKEAVRDLSVFLNIFILYKSSNNKRILESLLVNLLVEEFSVIQNNSKWNSIKILQLLKLLKKHKKPILDKKVSQFKKVKTYE